MRTTPDKPAGTADSAGLLERMASGDTGALRALYDRLGGRVYGLALKVLRQPPDAEEVLQETFVEVWRRAREYDPSRGGVEAWLLTIARTRAIDRLRSGKASARRTEELQRSADPSGPAAPAPIEAVEQRQARERVLAALGTLPAEQRRTVELAYYEGLTHREIAEKTGDPLGTVKTRLRLGMEKLSALLKRTEGEP